MNNYRCKHGKTQFEFLAPDSDTACWELQKLHLDNFLPAAKYTIALASTGQRLGTYECEGITRDEFFGPINDAYQLIYHEAKRDFNFVWSRGKWLYALDGVAGSEALITAGDCWELPKAMKDVRRMIQKIRDRFPTCTEIWVQLGTDGSDTMDRFDYTPYASEDTVLIWKQKTCHEIMFDLAHPVHAE